MAPEAKVDDLDPPQDGCDPVDDLHRQSSKHIATIDLHKAYTYQCHDDGIVIPTVTHAGHPSRRPAQGDGYCGGCDSDGCANPQFIRDVLVIRVRYRHGGFIVAVSSSSSVRSRLTLSAGIELVSPPRTEVIELR